MDRGAFFIGGAILHNDIEEIYFLTRLSHRGKEVNIWTRPHRGFLVQYYIVTYYGAHIEKIGSQLPIKQIVDIGLNITILTMARETDFDSPRLHSWTIFTM